MRNSVNKIKAWVQTARSGAIAISEDPLFFKQIVELSPLPLVINFQGNIAYLNPAGAKLFGASDPGELIGKPGIDFVHQDSRDAFIERLRQDREKSTMRPTQEFKILTLDGREKIVESTAATIEFEGNFASLAVFRDITDLKETEEGFHRLASMVRSSFDAITILGLDGRFTHWNPGATRLYGWSAEEALGRHVTLLAPPGQEETMLATFDQVIQGENVQQARHQRQRKDGSLVDISRSMFPVENADGQVVGACSIARDVTAENQAELADRSQQELYRRLVELSPEPVVVVSSGQVAYLNDAAVRLWGASSQDEIVGKPTRDLFYEEDKSDTWERNAALETEGTELPVREAKIVRFDGQVRHVEATGTAINFQDQKAALFLIRDITARKQAEETMRELAVVEERNRLAREIHDTLAQSLTGMLIQLDIANQLIDQDQGLAKAELESVRELARKSLEEARRSVWNLQPEVLSTGSLLDAIKNDISHFEDGGLVIKVRSEGAEPKRIDRRIQLAILRITQEALNNVIHHAKANQVTVQIDFAEPEIHLSITDNGVGFDPNAAVGMRSPTSGGFGLKSMQERTRQASGRMFVQSSPGLGTCIKVCIPYAPSEQTAEPRTTALHSPLAGDAAQSTQASADDIRVMVVDDHEVVRQGLRSILDRTAGITVIAEAEDGEAAMEKIASLRPDVVLMDVQMPLLDGVETLRKLSAAGIDSRVILLSVYAKDEQLFEGLRAGARGYLMKETSGEDLVSAIRTVHQGGSLLQPVIADRLIERLHSGADTPLTGREMEVLKLVASGSLNREIAEHLSVSLRTVRFHVENVFQKLGVRTRTQAVRVATEKGLLR